MNTITGIELVCGNTHNWRLGPCAEIRDSSSQTCVWGSRWLRRTGARGTGCAGRRQCQILWLCGWWACRGAPTWSCTDACPPRGVWPRGVSTAPPSWTFSGLSSRPGRTGGTGLRTRRIQTTVLAQNHSSYAFRNPNMSWTRWGYTMSYQSSWILAIW